MHTCSDSENPNYELMAANLDVLRSAKDAACRTLEVIELTQWPYFDLDGQTLMVSYANAYVANGGVVVPLANHPLDAEVLDTFGRAFPEHEIVGVPAKYPARGWWSALHHPADSREGMSALGDFDTNDDPLSSRPGSSRLSF